MWVHDEGTGMNYRRITYVPGLFKVSIASLRTCIYAVLYGANAVNTLLQIFDEILVNAADNKQRDPSMDMLKITIDPDTNTYAITFRPLRQFTP